MRVRTAEVVAVLSLAIDLATRAPFEHGLRSTAYALQLARALRVGTDDARRLYYVTALAGAGDASADLAVLVDAPAAVADDSTVARISRVARRLDTVRSAHPRAAADNLMRSSVTHPADHWMVAEAVLLEPPVSGSAWADMLAAEPEPQLRLAAADIDSALAALGVFGALASPYFSGHSAAVSALAAVVAERRGMSPDEVTRIRRAGLLHDIVRAGVAREVWERPGALGAEDWAEVQDGVRAAEQLLSRVPWLAEIGTVGARRDSSDSARILAATDAYCAMIADRPHRPAMSAAAAARTLRAEAQAGRFDPDVADSVITAAALTDSTYRS